MPAAKRETKKTSKPSAERSLPALPASNRKWIIGVCFAIAALVGIVFGQTWHHEFVNFDDVGYVYDNAVVQQGLTGGSIAWAFSHTVVSNWHPLTMLTHMADCQFYGVNVGGHHLTNVLLHAATAILLFLGWVCSTLLRVLPLLLDLFGLIPCI